MAANGGTYDFDWFLRNDLKRWLALLKKRRRSDTAVPRSDSATASSTDCHSMVAAVSTNPLFLIKVPRLKACTILASNSSNEY